MITISTIDQSTKDILPISDTHEAKRITRKIDYRLLPILTLLYILSFIDRSNIGNAKVAGMNEDLDLSGFQYNMVLTVFFFPYSFFEVPSNIILQLTRPSIWMTTLVISWGTVCSSLRDYNNDSLLTAWARS